jgi:predicted amidophosphoribosyltransferase
MLQDISSEDAMPNCICCGHELSEDAEFCEACGKKVERPFDVCPRCGTKMRKEIYHTVDTPFNTRPMSEVLDTLTVSHVLDFLKYRKRYVCPKCNYTKTR